MRRQRVQSIRTALQFLAIATVVFGPPLSLLFWWRKEKRVPGPTLYVCATGAICIAIFWPAFLGADAILGMQFREIVPNGEWTPSDEAKWTVEQKSIVSAYFGDGGRNVFSVVAPYLILAYAIFLWVVAKAAEAVARRVSR
jgi:hypothetical protein